MRKFVALLFVVGAGYFIYTHPELYKPLAESGKTAMKQAAASVGLSPKEATAMKEPFAWKTVSRNGTSGPFDVVIELMDGNRWRIEVRKPGSSKIRVAVCDGSTAVSNPTISSPDKLDPGPASRKMIAVAARNAVIFSKITPQVTEQMDGHNCWKTSVNFEGAEVQLWIDAGSSFPVCSTSLINGKYVECHYSPLQVDFAGRSAEFFGTDHTEPLFADYLTPESNAPAATQSAALPPAPGAGSGLLQGQKILVEAVQIQVPYGTAIIPKGTSVQIVRDTGGTVTVRNSTNQEFTVRRDQIQ